MKNFSIVVAMDEKMGIGKKGQMPWHLPVDLKHFKDITTKVSAPQKINAVIMGRKTWESLPTSFRPLPGRLNFVLTHNQNYSLPAEVIRSQSLDEAFRLCAAKDWADKIEQIFVIGGAETFKEAIGDSRCQNLFVTHILAAYSCDTFFPSIPEGFRETNRSPQFSAGAVQYYFSQYQFPHI